MLRTKEYKVSTQAIQAGLVRESKKILPVTDFVKKPLAVSFASYNLCGFYFSSINHCKHFLAEDLSRIFARLQKGTTSESKEIQSETLTVDPEIIGSLYSAHLESFQAYFVSWMISDRLNIEKDSIKSKEMVIGLINAVVKNFEDNKKLLIDILNKMKSDKNYIAHVKLLDMLIDCLNKPINIDTINNSEILKFAMAKNEINDIHKEIKAGIEKRKLFERWQIWYKRQLAIFEMLEHVTKNMGVNVINFQEGNAESLRQINSYLKSKNMNYTVVAFSDQTGEVMADPIAIEGEGFKAKDGLGFTNAIMFDVERFALLKSKQYWISTTPDKPSVTPGGLAHQKNSITMIILQDKKHDKQFAVFNTHITPLPGGHEFSREKIIEVVNKAVSDNNNIPFIISDDFNTFPDVEAEAKNYLEYIKRTNTRDWRDLFSESTCVNKVIEGATYAGYGFDQEMNVLDERTQTIAPKVLDHVFLNGFEAFGNAFKLIFPINVNEKDNNCQLDLKSETDSNPAGFIQKIRKHQTASDHIMIGTQLMFYGKRLVHDKDKELFPIEKSLSALVAKQ